MTITCGELDVCERALVDASNACDDWRGDCDREHPKAKALDDAIDVALRIAQSIQEEANRSLSGGSDRAEN